MFSSSVSSPCTRENSSLLRFQAPECQEKTTPRADYRHTKQPCGNHVRTRSSVPDRGIPRHQLHRRDHDRHHLPPRLFAWASRPRAHVGAVRPPPHLPLGQPRLHRLYHRVRPEHKHHHVSRLPLLLRIRRLGPPDDRRRHRGGCNPCQGARKGHGYLWDGASPGTSGLHCKSPWRARADSYLVRLLVPSSVASLPSTLAGGGRSGSFASW